MKKIPILLTLLLLFLFCTACTNVETNNKTIVNSSTIESQKKDDENDSLKSSLNNNIEQIYITVLDSTFKIDASEEILNTLELSKSASEPVFDEKAMTNAGTIKIKYADNDNLEDFGYVYITDSMDLYIKSNKNKNNAVVEIDFDLYQNSSDDNESNTERFEPFYKSLFN
jgi:hypothetical protein